MLLCLKGASKSFDFCTAWTSACCRLDVDQCRRVRRLSSNKCKPQMMLASHARRREIDVCRPRTIVAAHVRRRLIVVRRPKEMRAGHARCRMTNVCRTRAMAAGHARRRLSDVHRPRPMQVVHDQRLLSDVHRSQPMRAVHDQCRLADDACRWPSSLARSTEATLEACKIRLMLPAVGRRQCRPADAHTPRHMRAGRGRCYLSLADIACLMHPYHVRCAQALDGVTCRWAEVALLMRADNNDVAQPMRTRHG